MNNHHYDAATRCVANKGAAMQATETTKEAMVSKLVAAWEDKNTKRAAQGAGLSLMALSLAACGGSSSTPVDTTPTTPTITPASETLTAGADVLDSTVFTTVADTITADGTTLTGNDVIVEGHAGDGDTLNVAVTGDFDATPTVTGVENIIFNATMANAAGALDIVLDNIASGTVTVNSLAHTNIYGAADQEPSVAVTGAGDVTVEAGTNVTELTVTMAADAQTVVNAGSATSVTINSADAETAINQVATFVANGDVTLTVADGTNGALTDLHISATTASVVTLVDSNSNLDTVVADANTTVHVADLNAFSADAISGAALVTAATVTADTDASNISSAMKLTTIVANKVLTFADAANVTLAAGTTAFTAELVEDATVGTNTAGSIDLTLAGGYTGAITMGSTGDYLGTVNVATDVTQSALAIVANTTDGVINLSGAGAVTIASGTKASQLDATNLTGALTVTASADLVDITGGSGNDAITGISGVNGIFHGLGGNDNIVGDAGNDSIYGGDGNDTITSGGGADLLDGGAGTDVLVASTNMTTSTFSNFEIMQVAGGSTYDFKATQLSGSSLIVDGTGTGTAVLSIDGTGAGIASSVNLSTINLSELQFAGTPVTTIVNVSTIDGAQFVSGQAFTITGSSAADTITGSANADTISGGAGNDVLNGGAGADVLTGGAGSDTFTYSASSNGVDTVTDFTVGAVADGGDVLDLSALAASPYAHASGASGTTAITATAGYTTDAVDIASKLVFIDNTAATVDTLAEVQALVTDAGASAGQWKLANGDKALVAYGDVADGAQTYHLYEVTGATGATDTWTDLGTFVVNDGDALLAANFNIA